MIIRGVIASLVLAMGALAFGGCAMVPPLGGTDYGVATARSAMQVHYATVIGVGHALIHARNAAARSQAVSTGAILGVVIGSTVGAGAGRLLATLVGAVSGGVIGDQVGAHEASAPALVLTLREDGGRTFAVTQETAGSARFYRGEQVGVLVDGSGTVRIIPAPSGHT